MSRTIHDLRVFNFAVVDILGTFLIGYIIYRYKLFNHFCITSFPSIMIVLFISAIFIHVSVKTPTTLNNLLGLSGPSPRSTNNRIISLYNPIK